MVFDVKGVSGGGQLSAEPTAPIGFTGVYNELQLIIHLSGYDFLVHSQL